MAAESPPSAHSGGKHRRSPYDGEDSVPEEDASKRRKRHHHHRRRHGKHNREEDEEIESAQFSAASDAPPPLPPTSVYVENLVDDEREEGEILDDDEGDGPVDGGRVIGTRSDVSSGEIDVRALGDSYPDLLFSGEEDKLSCERTKLAAPVGSELGADGIVESGPTLERSVTTHESKNDGKTHDKAYKSENNGITLRMETMNVHSKSHEREVENEKKHRRGYRKDSKRQGRSRSPDSEDSTHAIKHLRKDDQGNIALTHSLESESRRYFQSMDSSERTLTKKKRSASPRSSSDRYNPSTSSQHRESRHRDQSRSQSYEKGSELSGDGNHRDAQVYPLDSLRRDYGRSDKIDGYSNRIETSDKDTHRKRERSSSYNRHDERRRSRERERERERERQKINVKDRDNMEVDRGAHGERETSSYSRHERRDDRRQSRERGREHERDLYGGSMRGSHRDRSRDTSGDKHKDRERSKDIDHRRGRDGIDTDRNRAREREVSVHRGREEHVRDQTGSRDRRRDSRNSNHDEAEQRKGKKRSKELSNDAGSGREHTAGAREQPISTREEDVEDYEEKIEQQLVNQDEEDIDKIKEESRKRRQAILEKYRQLQQQQEQQEQEQQHLVESSCDGNKKDSDEASLEDNLQGSSTNNADNQSLKEETQNEQENVDVDVYVADPSFTVNKSPLENGASPSRKDSTDHGLGEGSPKSERPADMFTDDIFGESPAAVRKMGKDDGPKMDRNFLHDNWDDAEGYYSYRFGEVLDGRYEVISAHGKGVFSTVVRAKDLKAGRGDPEEVAIKIIRNNETMYKAGRDELVILKKLAGADPEDKRHCVRFLSSFKYRNHLCLVFESLHMNLREVLKKFGRNIGLKLTAVRAYAKQLFIALKHLRNCGVLHCDIKPDNMLVNESKNVLKLCDFGNAMFAGKNEITPYLVSRFYRAPEIILGLPYDHPMDIWSVGCCLYELYTGKVLFPGPSNNDMLRLHMELKGAFPKKMLRKGAFADHHFDQDLNFHATEEDPVTKKAIKRLLLNIKPKDISILISGSPGEDSRMLANFKDLLEQIFILDPEKRMTVNQALGHPFITGK